MSTTVKRGINFNRVLPELPITMRDIHSYKSNYIGSEMEKADVKKAYLKYQGCLNQMASEVLFMDYSQEPRIRMIINLMILRGELPRFKNYAEDNPISQLRRFRDYRKEEKKALALICHQKSLLDRKANRLKRVGRIVKKYKDPKLKSSKKRRTNKERLDDHVNQSYLQSTVSFMGEVVKELFC